MCGNCFVMHREPFLQSCGRAGSVGYLRAALGAALCTGSSGHGSVRRLVSARLRAQACAGARMLAAPPVGLRCALAKNTNTTALETQAFLRVIEMSTRSSAEGICFSYTSVDFSKRDE